jgi:hypothetical protein
MRDEGWAKTACYRRLHWTAGALSHRAAALARHSDMRNHAYPPAAQIGSRRRARPAVCRGVAF